MLERRSLDLSGVDAPLVMPRYLAVEPVAGKAAVPPHLPSYESAFAAAAGSAERLHRGFVDDGRSAAAALVALYGQAQEEAQRTLDVSLFDLWSVLSSARRDLATAEADAVGRLELQAETARLLIRAAARGSLATVAGRKAVIEERISLARRAAADVEGELAFYAGLVDRAGPRAAQAFSSLQADPSPAHVPNAAADYAQHAPQMQAAENEPLDPAVRHRAGNRSTAFTQATGIFAGQLATAATSFQRSATEAFQPFQNYITSLGTTAPRQIASMRRNALRQVDKTLKNGIQAVQRSRNQVELSLIERYRRGREQIVGTAERGGRAQESGIARAGEGQLQGYRAIAAAQAGTIVALHDEIGRQRGQTPEQFAGYVKQASDRTAARAEEAARARRLSMAAGAVRMRDQTQARSSAGTASQARTARSLAEQISASGRQSGTSLMTQVLALEAGLRQMAEPIAKVIDSFPIPAEAVRAAMETTLWEKLGTAREQAQAAYSGGSPPANDSPPPATSSPAAPQPPAGTGSNPRDFVETATRSAREPAREEQIVSVTGTIAAGVVGNVRERGEGLMGQMTVLGQNPNETLRLVRGLTALRGQAVIRYYNQERPGNLWDHIALYMSFGNPLTGVDTRVHSATAVYNYLLGNRAAGALSEIQAATEFWNNADQVREAMTALTPADVAAMRGLDPHGTILDAVENDLDDADRRMFHILRNVTEANAADSVAAVRAIQLEAQLEDSLQTDPERGADNAFDAMERAALAGGSTRLEGANEFGLTADFEVETPEQAEERRNRSWQETVARLGNNGERHSDGAAGGLAYLRRLTERTRIYSDGDQLYQASIRPEQALLLTNLAAHGPGAPQTRAAQLAVEETRRGGGKPERLEHALHDPELNADMANPDRDPPRPGEPDEAARRLQRARDREAEMYRLYDRYRNPGRQDPPRSVTEIRADLGARLRAGQSDERQGRLMEMQVVRGLTDPATAALAFEHAVDRVGTDEDLLRRTMGRMSRGQIDAAVAKYDDTHTPHLYERLGLFEHSGGYFRELSGDDRLEIQVLAMGQPRNDRERAEVARMTSRLQLSNSGWAGRLLAREEHRRLERSHDRLVQLMGVGSEDMAFDARGRLQVRGPNGERRSIGNFNERGEFKPSPGSGAMEFTMMMATNERNAEAYKTATDNIANAITTTLVVAAAIISTVATGGAAASIWIPVLVTAGAGIVGMAASWAIKGGRYGYEDAGRDFGMTVVQAATAGIGAGLGIARAGGSTAFRAAMASRMISNQGFRAISLLDEALIAGASGAIGGGGSALFDDRAWDRGEWLANIGHGMRKGFLGGFAGGVVTGGTTRAIGGVARGMGRASGAVTAFSRGRSADVGSRLGRMRGDSWSSAFPTTLAGRTIGGGLGGAATRWVEIDYDRRRGAYQGSRSQAFEEIADAASQNTLQSFLEGVGEHASDNSPRMKAWRESIMAGQAPPALPPRAPQAEGSEAGGRRAPAQVDDEATGGTVARTADETPEGRRTVRASNDNGNDPVHAQVALAKTDMVSLGAMPEGSVLVHPDSTSLDAANDNYTHLVNADPSREVALYRNADTGEYVVIQGSSDWVASIRPGGEIERLGSATSPVSRNGVPKPGGRWMLAHHYHPNRPGEAGTNYIRRLPSGANGDFGVIIREAHAHGEAGRTSRIYFIDNGRINYTDFGYDARTRRVWIDVADPVTGVRSRRNFDSVAAYNRELARVSANPELAARGPAAQRRTADAPEPQDLPPPPPGAREANDPSGTADTPQAEGVAGARAGRTEADDPAGTVARTGDSPEPRRALSSGSAETALTDADRVSIRQLVDRATEAGDYRRALAALEAAGAADPTLAMFRDESAAAAAAVSATVQRLGLVGEADSMARLHLIVNDDTIPMGIRREVAALVLEANRAHMVATGELGPGDTLHLIFHGAPEGRSGSIRREGIDLSKLGDGRSDDFSRGLYMTSDLDAAQLYRTRSGDAGEIFPFLVRQKQLGNVVDVREGGPHRAAWDAFLDQSPPAYPPWGAPYFRNAREYATNSGKVALKDMDRGSVFEAFLRQQGLTDAAVIHGDLGKDATTGGIGHGDQFAIRSHDAAQLLNEQLGFRRAPPDLGVEDGPLVARTADPDSTVATGPALPIEPAARQRHALDIVIETLPTATLLDQVGSTVRGLSDHHSDLLRFLSQPDAVARHRVLQEVRDAMLAKGMNWTQIELVLIRMSYVDETVGAIFRSTAARLSSDSIAAAVAGLQPPLRQILLESPIALQILHTDPDLLKTLFAKFGSGERDNSGRDFEGFLHTELKRTPALTATREELGRLFPWLLSDEPRARVPVIDIKDAGRTTVAGLGYIPGNRTSPGDQITAVAQIDHVVVGPDDHVVPGTRIDHPNGQGTVIDVVGGVAKVSFDNRPGVTVDVPLADGSVTLATDPRTGKVQEVVPLLEGAARQAAVREVLDLRAAHSMVEYDKNTKSGTVAIARIGEQRFPGTTSDLKGPKSVLKEADRLVMLNIFKAKGYIPESQRMRSEQYIGHAEFAALFHAKHELGQLPPVVDLYVDRPTCTFCRNNLDMVANYFGIAELRVYYIGANGVPELHIYKGTNIPPRLRSVKKRKK
jgi:hypothetical protein